MSDFVSYLYELSQTQPRDSRYNAFAEALKAFDNGIVPMFVFSDEDMAYSREHGDLPEHAQPEALVIKFAALSSRTGGQFGPPWYIVKKLREVADRLEEAGLQEFERWLEHERLEGVGLERLERTLPDAEARLEAIRGVMQAYDALHGEGMAEPGSYGYNSSVAHIVKQCIDLGVNLPVCEDEMQYEAMVQRLPELLHDEIHRTEARIHRTREQMAQAGGDPDGFGGGGDGDEAAEEPLIE